MEEAVEFRIDFRKFAGLRFEEEAPDAEESDADDSDAEQLAVLCPKAEHLDADSPAGKRALAAAKDCRANKRKTHHLDDACECVANDADDDEEDD